MFLKDFKPCAMFNNDIKNVIMLPLSFTPFKKKLKIRKYENAFNIC